MNNSILNVNTDIELEEGSENYVKWRAKDVAENGYTESNDLKIKIDLNDPVFSNSMPSFEDLQKLNYIICKITVQDQLSGVDGVSIQYRKSVEGPAAFGSWEDAGFNGLNSKFQCEVNMACKGCSREWLDRIVALSFECEHRHTLAG
jgi:hypothetical protein